MKYSVVHDSRIGGRRSNQDRVDWAQTEKAAVLVVCDGMGGHRFGEVAAQIAVKQVIGNFRNQANPRLDDPARFLAEALRDAHDAINYYAAQRAIALREAPRTTCIVCVVQDGRATWAHAGDSRLYLLRDGGVALRTSDHSRVQMLLDAGEITAEEARHHPQRNLIMSCLGGDAGPRIDVSAAHPLLTGDILALCTDGTWAPLAESLPEQFSGDFDAVVTRTLDAAEAVGGPNRDNLSLLVLRWESAPVSADNQSTAVRSTTVATQIQDFSPSAVALSEEEIDRVVAEIRASIPRSPSGA